MVSITETFTRDFKVLSPQSNQPKPISYRELFRFGAYK